jgi:hypothetical protein
MMKMVENTKMKRVMRIALNWPHIISETGCYHVEPSYSNAIGLLSLVSNPSLNKHKLPAVGL